LEKRTGVAGYVKKRKREYEKKFLGASSKGREQRGREQEMRGAGGGGKIPVLTQPRNPSARKRALRKAVNQQENMKGKKKFIRISVGDSEKDSVEDGVEKRTEKTKSTEIEYTSPINLKEPKKTWCSDGREGRRAKGISAILFSKRAHARRQTLRGELRRRVAEDDHRQRQERVGRKYYMVRLEQG